MKNQGVLKKLDQNSQKILTSIVDTIEERKKNEKKILQLEETLTIDVANFIKNHKDYHLFEKFFSLQVEPHSRRDENLPTKTLLDAISLQIATSVNEHYDTPEDMSVGFINWGAKFYKIPTKEDLKGICQKDETNIRNTFKQLNDFLFRELDVEIFFHGNLHPLASFIPFQIRTFPAH